MACTRLAEALLLLRACLRHLADEDSWERAVQRDLINAGSADGFAGCPADAGTVCAGGHPHGEQGCAKAIRPAGHPHRELGCGHGADADEADTSGGGQGLDRGALWQREMERRWSGVRRCC